MISYSSASAVKCAKDTFRIAEESLSRVSSFRNAVPWHNSFVLSHWDFHCCCNCSGCCIFCPCFCCQCFFLFFFLFLFSATFGIGMFACLLDVRLQDSLAMPFAFGFPVPQFPGCHCHWWFAHFVRPFFQWFKLQLWVVWAGSLFIDVSRVTLSFV